MGGTPPSYSAPQIVMPKPTAPRQYRTFVPYEDMGKLRDFGKRVDEQTAALQEDRFRSVGTPAELGERARARELRENAAYLASLPGQMKDPGLMGIQKDASGAMAGTQLSQQFQPGTFGEATAAGKEGLDAAKIAFKKAQKVKDEKAKSLVDPSKFDPSWASGGKEAYEETYRMKDMGEVKK